MSSKQPSLLACGRSIERLEVTLSARLTASCPAVAVSLKLWEGLPHRVRMSQPPVPRTLRSLCRALLRFELLDTSDQRRDVVFSVDESLS
jgi:hypothetical protein